MVTFRMPVTAMQWARARPGSSSGRPREAGASYVNLIPTPQGGTHEAGLKDGLYQAMLAFMQAHGLQAKNVKILSGHLSNPGANHEYAVHEGA